MQFLFHINEVKVFLGNTRVVMIAAKGVFKSLIDTKTYSDRTLLL